MEAALRIPVDGLDRRMERVIAVLVAGNQDEVVGPPGEEVVEIARPLFVAVGARERRDLLIDQPEDVEDRVVRGPTNVADVAERQQAGLAALGEPARNRERAFVPSLLFTRERAHLGPQPVAHPQRHDDGVEGERRPRHPSNQARRPGRRGSSLLRIRLGDRPKAEVDEQEDERLDSGP